MDDRVSEAEPAETAAEAAAEATVILTAGASGAETASLLRVLSDLPPGPGLAVVIALQHRQALDEAAFHRALEERGSELQAAADGDPIEAGKTYLLGPELITTVEEGRFRTRPAAETADERGTIDSFFVSLAEDQDGNVIGLVLRGTGADGTLGLAAIKEAGGLTIAEENAVEAEPDASHSASALADFVLPVEEIAGRVALHVRHHARLEATQAATARLSKEAAKLAQIAAILLDHTGHDFHGYKRATFLRRVQRRMQVAQVDDPDAYLAVLRTRSDEAQQLFNDLLIGVTQFFRDRREFDFLESHIIPQVFEGKGRGDQLRVWVLGCSTGEEAYSLAILLREHAATLDAPPQIQIFASDIDGRALAFARVGRYTQGIVKDLPPERLARWFVKEGDTYCIAKELREMCVFSQHSIVKNPPFSRLDIVSCRNLLIYLGAELQSRVIPLFHFALNPGKFLFLGTSENVSRHAKLFTPVDRAYRVFRKVDTEKRILPELPFSPLVTRTPSIVPLARPADLNNRLSRRAERIVERYAPAYAVVDERFDVLHFSGNAGRFIHPAGGAATLNLPNLVHANLRPDLREALNTAASQDRVVHVDGLMMGEAGRRTPVDLVIEPAGDDGSARRGFVVVFKEGVARRNAGELLQDASAERDEDVRTLKAELGVTSERLQAMIEELESTNEELKSSNEEYQSLNEELQSANEELETSKEELQSVNEEVTTVNGELAHRVQELGQANNDLKNLLESTQIATIFLDNELRVTNFTPAVADVFHLVDTDLHRPIEHIKFRIAYPELQDDVRRVIRTLVAVDREIENTETGARYIVRVLPYRSIDNYIGGVVMTFTDVTSLTLAQLALQESEGRLRTLIEGIPQLVWRAEGSGRWTWSSPQWSAYTGLTEAESRDLGWIKAVHPEDRETAMLAWQTALDDGVLNVEFRLISAADQRYRWFHVRSTPVRGEDGQIVEWLGTSTEVDDLRRLQEEQRVMVAELQHRTRNLITVVRSIANQILRGSDSLGAFRVQFNDSLDALSRVQGLLSKSGQQPFTFGALLRMELDALGAGVGDNRVSVDGPTVPLRKSTVQTLALALHELATNACKYGALATEQGRLRVTWQVRQRNGDGERLRIEWVEEGFDRPAAPIDVSGGYGRRLIEQALPYTLDAETSYELSGQSLRCTIELPVSGSANSSEND